MLQIVGVSIPVRPKQIEYVGKLTIERDLLL